EVRIDQSPDGKIDLRKYNKGLGPVVVFGASNFPFAFSTAGGDTASAIGAGCSVIVKAHPAHVKTSQLMADAIHRGISKYGAPADIFSHVVSDSFEIGQQLVKHRLVKAVAFTGSFTGGKALFDLGQSRPDPIPVFAEMGSINPVFVLPDYLKDNVEAF
ncbi:MAG: aldehyde dehydrogenase family protein, partial [Sphingobacterium sp.]